MTKDLIKDNQQLEDQMQMATLMSKSLRYTIRRNYLEENECSSFFTPSESSSLLLPNFVCLYPSDAELISEFTLKKILTLYDSKVDWQLIFLVINDGKDSKIYMGVRDEDDIHYFLQNADYIFQDKDLHFEKLSTKNKAYKPDILEHMNKMRYGICLTGIPSNHNKSDLNKLLSDSNNDHSSAYIIIAEPINPDNIDNIIDKSFDFIQKIHQFAHINISYRKSQTQSTEKGTGSNNSNIQTESNTIGVKATFGSDLASVEAFVSHTNSKTTMNSQTEYSQVSLSDTDTLELQREFINPHVQAAENNLKEFANRLGSVRDNNWNVGVYYLSDEPDVVESVGRKLKGILKGSETLEPIRWHKLDPFIQHNEDVETHLHRFQNPPLVPNEDIKKHPFGPLFNGLTTPLTTSELSLLMNYK